MDNTVKIDEKKETQLLTEKFSAHWGVSYEHPSLKLLLDYTANLYSPMHLPLAGPYYPRPDKSPWWSHHNLQITYKGFRSLEFLMGGKNLLNWKPTRSTPFLIARSHDPFDRNVEYSTGGEILRTVENPYGLSFDPSYMYAPNHGVRLYIGARLSIK